jgi:hypothetical protein
MVVVGQNSLYKLILVKGLFIVLYLKLDEPWSGHYVSFFLQIKASQKLTIFLIRTLLLTPKKLSSKQQELLDEYLSDVSIYQ